MLRQTQSHTAQHIQRKRKRLLPRSLQGRSAAAQVVPQPPAAAGSSSQSLSLQTSAKAGAPLLRTLELRYVHVNRINAIDVVGQTFNAVVTLELWCKNGKLDAHLSSRDAQWPVDENGQSTFRPSLAWYATKLDFNNAIAVNPIEEPVIKHAGDDLGIAVRYEGTWSENFELEMFPFDAQPLTMSLTINCRTAGMTPVRLTIAPDVVLCVDRSGFSPRHAWHVHEQIGASRTLVGSAADRKFPTLNLSVLVWRRPGFVVWNVLVPSGTLPLISSFAYSFRLDEAGERLAVTLTSLLTAAAYKVAVINSLPEISYLTVTDKYMLSCSAQHR